MKLTDLNTLKSVLSDAKAAPDKRFGQNFLISSHVVEEIADKCGASPEDGILEIGPGVGTLSSALCERYSKVAAVEIDRKMVDVLSRTMAGYDNFTVINRDILKTDLKALIAEHFPDMNVTVCANLPYYITSPIIMMLLESRAGFDNITVMIQKEVAERLTAKPDTGNYGAITPVTEYYASAEKILNVPAGCFYPAPKVDSAVLRLKVRKNPPVTPKDEEFMFKVIRAAFAMRRKTLLNSVSATLGTDKSKVLSAIIKCGFDERVRGEELSLSDLCRLSDELFVLNK